MPIKKSARKIRKKQVVKRKIHKKLTVTGPVLQPITNSLNPPTLDQYTNPIKSGTNARELLLSRMMGGSLPLGGGVPGTLSSAHCALQTVGNLNNERRLEDINFHKQREENLHNVIKEEIKKGNQELKEAKKKRKQAEHEKEKQELKLDDAKYDNNKAELLENKAEMIKKRINDLNRDTEQIKTDFSIVEGKELISAQNALIAEEKIRLEETERKLQRDEAGKKANALKKQLELIEAETNAKKELLNSAEYTNTVEAHKENYKKMLKSQFENKLLDEMIKKQEENALNDFRNNSSLTEEDYKTMAKAHYDGYKNAELLAAQYRDKAHENQILKAKWENLLEKHKEAELKVQSVDLENTALEAEVSNITVEKEKYISGETKKTLDTLAEKNAEADKQKRLIENRKKTRKTLEEAYLAEQQLTHTPQELSAEELTCLNAAAEKRAEISNSKRKISYRNALLAQNKLNAETSAEYDNTLTELNKEETKLLNETAAKKVANDEMIRKLNTKKQLMKEGLIAAEAKAEYEAQKENLDEEEINLINTAELSRASAAQFNSLKAQKEENRKAQLLNTKTIAHYNSLPNGATEEEIDFVEKTAQINAQTDLANKYIAANEDKNRAELNYKDKEAKSSYLDTKEAKEQYERILEYKKNAAISDEKSRQEDLLVESKKKYNEAFLARSIHSAIYEAEGASAEENLAIQFNALVNAENELKTNDRTVLFNKLVSLSQGNPTLWQHFCENNPVCANINSSNYLAYDSMYLKNYVDLFINFINQNPSLRET